jgi:hypothetical protein
MPLPFPHGTAPGQIANGSFFDNGDTPGSTGGRFVGFGEYGTSAITNRGLWALSCNIDYLYHNHSAPKANPAVAKFTSSGVAQFTITDTVFCGDDTPPLPLPEAMLLLFAVLDDKYYTLTDGSGNDVRVTNVTLYRDYMDDPVYGEGFVANPTVTFCTVNPSTGAVVQDPYTIPNGVVVQVAYGSQSSLEDLPIGALLRFGVLGLRSGASGGSGGASHWLTTEDPPVDQGADGDFDLNVATGDVYGPKVGGVWGEIVGNIKGPPGDSGSSISAEDYVFAKEDFGVYNPDSYDLDAVIGTWLQVVGVGDGTIGKDVDVVFDRSTVLLLRAPSTAGAIGLSGPALYINPTTSLLKFNVGFALDTLSQACGGETYTVIAGFNPDTIATDTGAYFYIDEHSDMYAVWKDDTGDQTALIPITIQANTWYDCTISFNSTSVDFIVNGVTVYTTDFTAASKALLISVPLRLTNTYGVDPKQMWIDYTEMHTEGHQPRALT